MPSIESSIAATLGQSVIDALNASPSPSSANPFVTRGRLPFDVRDYGAVGDGVTDDSAAINAALYACRIAGGGVVVFPHTYTGYAIATGLTVTGTGIHLAGEGTALYAGNPSLKWIGATSASATMITVTNSSHSFSMSNIRLDANNKAGVCLYIIADSGSATHSPSMSNIHFENFTAWGLVLGSNSTSVPCNGQMRIVRADNLSFAGAAGSSGILLNAENCEQFLASGLYFDPSVSHVNHIYSYRGGLNISGLLTTRATDYAIISYQQVVINGWRAEDRYLITMEGVDPGAPSVLQAVEQRPDAATLSTDWVMKLYASTQSVTIMGATVQGLIVIGPTGVRSLTCLGVFFEGGGDYAFLSPQNQRGIFHNATTGSIVFRGTGATVKTMSEAGVLQSNLSATTQQVLATGAGHTVDDVITALQNIGLVKQS